MLQGKVCSSVSHGPAPARSQLEPRPRGPHGRVGSGGFGAGAGAGGGSSRKLQLGVTFLRPEEGVARDPQEERCTHQGQE